MRRRIGLSCLVSLVLVSISDWSWAWTPSRPSVTFRHQRLRVQSLKVSDTGSESASTSRSSDNNLGRRRILGDVIAACSSAGVLLGTNQVVRATTPATVGEAVRRSVANLPGYGPTDVFFPKSWAGLWRVQRQVSLGGNTGKSVTLDYVIRFLPSIDDDAVVADRGFNQANLE